MNIENNVAGNPSQNSIHPRGGLGNESLENKKDYATAFLKKVNDFQEKMEVFNISTHLKEGSLKKLMSFLESINPMSFLGLSRLINKQVNVFMHDVEKTQRNIKKTPKDFEKNMLNIKNTKKSLLSLKKSVINEIGIGRNLKKLSQVENKPTMAQSCKREQLIIEQKIEAIKKKIKPSKFSILDKGYDKVIKGPSNTVNKAPSQELLKNLKALSKELSIIDNTIKSPDGRNEITGHGEIEKTILRALRRVPFLVNFTPVGMVTGLAHSILGVENATNKEKAIEGAKFIASIVPVVGNFVDIVEGLYGLMTGKRIGTDIPQTTTEALFSIGIGIGGLVIDFFSLGTSGAPVKAAFKAGWKVGLKKLPGIIINGVSNYIAKNGAAIIKNPVRAVGNSAKWLGNTLIKEPVIFAWKAGKAVMYDAPRYVFKNRKTIVNTTIAAVTSPIQTSKNLWNATAGGVASLWNKAIKLWNKSDTPADKPPGRLMRSWKINEEVYLKRKNGTVEKNWRVYGVHPNRTYDIIRYDGVTRERCRPEKIWSIEEIEGQRRGDLLADDVALFEHQKLKYLKKYTTLSKQDYDIIFHEWSNIKQSNVGNCYLIAALNTLRFSTHCEFLIRTSFKRVEGGWEVKIPLGSPDASSVFITQADLRPQKNSNYNKMDSDGNVDTREYLHPVEAPQGYQVLEAAFNKKLLGEGFDRQKTEGGKGHRALLLLLGTNFTKTVIKPSDAAISFAKGTIKKRGEVKSFLNSYDTAKFMATVGTPYSRGGANTFMINGVKFYNSHAYSIVSVNKFTQEVYVSNPHNTNNTIKLSYTDFMSAFSNISAVETNYTKLTRGLQSQK
ncbi:hypothetical protein COB57_05590 [Candidatus Peregrinibacteria bacterium]|nr:MAG: hypothetical protein COB57_05590 [Candidatus Peregrinibacteria bacterium]